MLPVPLQINKLILARCLDGATWKSITLVSKSMYRLTRPFNEAMKRKFRNYLVEMLRKFPNGNWNWDYLSGNTSITWDIVKANLDKPWNWYRLSRNSSITWGIVKANLDKPWSWYGLSENSSITWDIVQANLDKPWSWKYLSSNPSIT